MMKDKKKRIINRLSAAVLCLIIVLSQLVGTAPWNSGFAAHAAEASSPIALKRIDGSGKAFIYHSFKETKTFVQGETYAFLTGIYDYEDAVSSLGAGAILSTTTTLVQGNNCNSYIKKKYGSDASAKIYVDVVTPGKDFDSCKFGGLYEVPNSGTPTEYRYFCRAGGAQNCGPYYAYTYEEESVVFTNVTATLNGIDNQGSEDPADYTVTITYDGDKTKVLDHGSYTVSFKAPDTVTFVVSDSVGNSITVDFQSPLAVRYDGNCDAAENVPATQEAWKNESVKITSQTPTRSGYAFVNWKNTAANTTYSSGQTITPTTSLRLLAQWRDTQAPTIGYTPTQVMTGDTNAAVEAAVRAALTITDNEPVSECTITVTVPADFTKTPGNKDVTVTATDKAGNTATKGCTVYVSSYVDISKPVFTESTKKLTATLNNPGTDTITASGFVWGIMNSPTLTVNNGSAATSTVASKAGDTLSVTAGNLQNGVTYYARAYITAGGITYYSEEIKIGLDLPAYGTFDITFTSYNQNNKVSTFTVTRTDGTYGKQTVYYRTVNGSAVGGTHFTHTYGTLSFASGVTTQTIKITEARSDATYKDSTQEYPATAHSNVARTYSVEIYRVEGGGSLGSSTSATREMVFYPSHEVPRSIYTREYTDAYQSVGLPDDGGKSGKRIADATSDQGAKNDNVNFVTSRYGTNYTTSSGLSDYYSYPNALPDYVKNTCSGWYFRYEMYAYEEDDGWEHAFIGTQPVADTFYSVPSGSAVSGVPGQLWACTFQQPEGKAHNLYSFPSTATGGGEGSGIPYKSNGTTTTVNGKCYVKLGADETSYLYFSATGANKDIWWINYLQTYSLLYDDKEPQLIAVAPMAGGTYKIGDTFVVSLIFDEIVDSVNSTNIKNVKVNTTWGTASYSGGADTNVLYFTGTVAANASGNLAVNSITNPGYIKDMCDSTGSKATASGSGTTTATVNTAMPNFTVKSNGIANGTGKATITVNDVKANTSRMSYVWSDSAATPLTGWVTLSSSELTTAKSSSGLPLSIRKEAGSGANNGKWYLHVKAVYSTTGATVYDNVLLDFGTAASPAAGSTPPALAVSADNTSWATSRKITISATGAEKLQYRKSGASAWTTLSNTATSVTVTENGYYTFLLTAGDETITKTVSVEKIDRVAPTASIGELTSASVESPKSGVYTKLVLPITCADAHSGVKTVQYKWTSNTTTPSSWSTLPTGATTLTYTASESTPTAKYLHIKVTDNVNYTCTTYSAAYTVISQAAVDNHAPTITITGAPTAWTNDMATLTWQLSNYDGKNYEVILPDGKISTEASGEVWARQNGDYTVTVRDLDYGGENSDTIKVDKLDYAPPTVTVSGGSDSWSKGDQTLTITASDSQSGVGEKWYKIVSNADEIPTEGLTELTGNTITVSDEGQCYVYYKVYDNAGDATEGIDREANKTEGFALVQIDKTAPGITFGDYSVGSGMTVTVKDSKDGVSSSGLASVTYEIKSGTEIWKTGSTPASGKTDVSFTLTELPAGDVTITVTAVDNAGNSSVSSKDIHIDIVSVDITWAAMEFTYSEGTWNAATHTYEGVGWKPDKTDGNKITVRNSGEVAVSVSYGYTPTRSTVSGGFTDGAAAVTAPVALPVKEEKSAWLILNGKPTESMNKAVLGSVTVTIGGD